MILRRLTELLCFYLLFTIAVSSQDAKLPEKIDEIGRTSCCDLNARIDYLFNKLQDEPGSRGFVVINGKKNSPTKNLGLERIVLGRLLNYYFIASKEIAIEEVFRKTRISILRGKEQEEPTVELWIATDGAASPVTENEWNLRLQNLRKAKIFYSDYGGDSGFCGDFDPKFNLVELLNSNPELKVNVVIYTRSARKFKNTSAEFKQFFIDRFGIKAKRLRFFHHSVLGGFNPEAAFVEFWIVPPKRSRKP